MTNRSYPFELPYHLGSFYLGMGISQLQEDGLWDRLPDAFRSKLSAAYETWDGVDITREDCDSIPDDVWAKIEEMLK